MQGCSNLLRQSNKREYKGTKNESVEKVRTLIASRNLKAVQKILVLCGNFRAFIEGYGRIAKPLSELLGKGIRFEWANNLVSIDS